jgi:hypothetical protein
MSGENCCHPSDSISGLVGSPALLAAKDTKNSIELNEYARFFPSFADSSIGRKLCWFDGSAGTTPQLGFSVLNEQKLLRMVSCNDGNCGNKQEVVANLLS